MSDMVTKPQPPPEPGCGVYSWDLVVADMRAFYNRQHAGDVVEVVVADMLARDAEGARRHGTRLEAGNRRDALVDTYQEALDAAAYYATHLYEQGRDRALSSSYRLILALVYRLRLEIDAR